MNSLPLVSIALCTYNGAGYLRQQMDTLVGQTYSNMEIVVVDDGSTDDTVAILNEYAGRFSNISLYSNPQNLGYAKNFERAISLCRGQYIALADQDDVWHLNKISLLLEHIGDSLLIYHDSELMDEDGAMLGKKMSDLRNFYAGDDFKVFLMANCVSGHALMFNRKLLQFFTGFNSVIFHDQWLAYIACNNGRITCVKSVMVKYRQHKKANTNILQQERGQKKQKESMLKIERQLQDVAALAAYPFNKDDAFMQKLLRLMQQRMLNYFSFSLAWLVGANSTSILYIHQKSAWSKFNFVVKFAWGYKLKQMFN